jgi:hypothetical protein
VVCALHTTDSRMNRSGGGPFGASEHNIRRPCSDNSAGR